MAAMALTRGHRIFQCAPWRQSRVTCLFSVTANPTGVAVVDVDSATRGRDAVAAGGGQLLVQKSDVTFPGLSNEVEPLRVKLKVLRRQQHGLHDDLIPRSTWEVLRNLSRAGYEAYLVGGSVRDLLLHQIPKDFDVLSTAHPHQVKKRFPGRSFIVGRRFPICHVSSLDEIIEVSSFSTKVRVKDRPKPKTRKISAKNSKIDGTEGWDERDFARWENSLKRDFTINGLMYDPFKRILYDYVGGLKDLQKLKVRTVIPADESFVEDSARILRAIRIAARLGCTFAKCTSRAIKDLRFSVLKLNKSRLVQESNLFFSYGAAEPTLRLLWRYGVLELILPLQAAYFVRQGFRRREKDSNLLLDLFRNLDKVVAPDRPCHGSLWVAILAFHLAISSKTSSPLVISAAALAMYHMDTRKGAQNAKRLHLKIERRKLKGDSIEENDGLKSECEEFVMEEAALLLEDAKTCLNQMMDASEITQTMRTLTGVDPEDLTAVGQTFSERAYGLFRGAIRRDGKVENPDGREDETEEGKKERANPEALTRGDASALCYIFSRIVLNTLYPRALAKS